MKAYLIKDSKDKYFAGGIWTRATRALLFSSKKEAIESFPELKYMDDIKFILVTINQI